jgi:hypothetical protein
MTNRSKTGLFIGLTFALLVAFVVAPTAQAQQSSLQPGAAPASPTLRPGADTANVALNVKYAPYNPQAGPLAGQAQPNIIITATPGTCSPYILVIGSLSTSVSITATDSTATDPKDAAINFQVALKPDAPGLETLKCDFNVKAEAGANPSVAPESNTLTQSITVKGTYIPLIQANVANGKLKTTGPQKEVPYQLELTNFGNAKTVVSFRITDEPKGSKWEALAPEAVTLNTEQSGLGNKQTIPFIVSTTYKNGWNNAVGGYTLELTPTAFIDPESKGTPTTVNVLARVRGVYVPGLEPFVLVAAVIGTALVARLSREE